MTDFAFDNFAIATLISGTTAMFLGGLWYFPALFCLAIP